jgi:hypothetical protein
MDIWANRSSAGPALPFFFARRESVENKTTANEIWVAGRSSRCGQRIAREANRPVDSTQLPQSSHTGSSQRTGCLQQRSPSFSLLVLSSLPLSRFGEGHIAAPFIEQSARPTRSTPGRLRTDSPKNYQTIGQASQSCGCGACSDSVKQQVPRLSTCPTHTFQRATDRASPVKGRRHSQHCTKKKKNSFISCSLQIESNANELHSGPSTAESD